MQTEGGTDWARNTNRLSAHAKLEKKESTMAARQRFKEQQKEITKLRKRKDLSGMTLDTNLPYAGLKNKVPVEKAKVR